MLYAIFQITKNRAFLCQTQSKCTASYSSYVLGEVIVLEPAMAEQTDTYHDRARDEVFNNRWTRAPRLAILTENFLGNAVYGARNYLIEVKVVKLFAYLFVLRLLQESPAHNVSPAEDARPEFAGCFVSESSN